MFCPDCPPARAARELVFDHGFLDNVLVAILPFGAVLLAVYVIARGLDDGGHTDG